MGPPMTFHAEALGVATDQHIPIGRPMRSMANATPFKFLRLVFENPRASFLRMAFVANVGIKFTHFSQAGSRPCPVRSMAIRALQRPLDHSMVVGKIELRFDLPMTGEAEIRVFLLQKMAGHLLRVNLMAAIATHGAQLMDASFRLKE
jgi:hypothetical protein